MARRFVLAGSGFALWRVDVSENLELLVDIEITIPIMHHSSVPGSAR
jgi:hypothetical protein